MSEELKKEASETVNSLKIDIDDSDLSEEEKQKVYELEEKINLHNTQEIIEYGISEQQKMAAFSEKVLERARTGELGEIGDLLANVVSEVQSIDEENSKGIARLFKKTKNTINAYIAKYDKAEANIGKIVENLENHQMALFKDIVILDKMYDANLTTYKELTKYILAGKRKLEEVRNTELKELQDKAKLSGYAEDAQAAKDLADKCNRFEKKLYDLQLSRTISIQTAPQIRLLQNADSQMAEKIQSVIVNTIPLWKNQMVISLGISHVSTAAKAENAVTNATNELLKKNAETLHSATVDVAKANERGIVDIETLEATNKELIDSLTEVLAIQKEGREKRAQAETQLRTMEDELKKKLLEISGD